MIVAERFARDTGGRGGIRFGLIVVAALLAIVSFSIRSNGALVAVSIFAVLAYRAAQTPRDRRRVVMGEMVVLTLLTSAFFLAYLRLLPDGSLAHLDYLTLAPNVLKRRTVETIVSGAEFFPFSILRHWNLLNAGTALTLAALWAALVAIGAWRHRDHSSGLMLFALLNLPLVLMFPSDGGPRYVFPLLPTAAILGASGLAAVAGSAVKHAPFARLAGSLPLVARLSQAACIVGMVATVVIVSRGSNPSAVSGPLTPASDSMFTFVRSTVPARAIVAFFKPRALRLFTSRMGIARLPASWRARMSCMGLGDGMTLSSNMPCCVPPRNASVW